MTATIRRFGQTVTAAELREQYSTQIAELPGKVAAQPRWASTYMNDLEVLRGRGDALADIEAEFDSIESWAVKQRMTVPEMLLLKFDTVTEFAVDAAAALATDTAQPGYYKGRSEMVRDVWRTLRRDPGFPGN